jgi:hypothetical protein
MVSNAYLFESVRTNVVRLQPSVLSLRLDFSLSLLLYTLFEWKVHNPFAVIALYESRPATLE